MMKRRAGVIVTLSSVSGVYGNAAQVTDAALRALSAEHTKPFFLWVHYYDAHGVPLRSRAVAHFAQTMRLAALAPGLYNWAASARWITRKSVHQ